MLVAGYSLSIARFTFVGEVVLIFWLLIKGRRMTGALATAATVPDAKGVTDTGRAGRPARR